MKALYIPAGLLALGDPAWSALAEDVSALTWGNFLFGNLLPVTLGNLLGGMILAWVYWAIYLKEG